MKNSKDISDPKKFYTDTPESGMKALELLGAARIKMLMRFPFFGKIAQNMTLIEDARCPTTAVDPKGRLYYNEKWVNSFNFADALFEFAHEVGHLYQRCFARKPKAANASLWNKAADWRVDTDLVDAGFTQSKISKIMVRQKEQDITRKLGTIPAIYKYLLQEAEGNTDCPACKQAIKDLQEAAKEIDKGNKSENEKLNNGEQSDEQDKSNAAGEQGEQGDSGHQHGSGGGLEHTCGSIRFCCAGESADLEEADPMDAQKWVEVLVGAKMYAESKGNMPGHLAAGIDSLTKSTVRWQDHLRSRAAKVFGRDRYSYKKYNRRGAMLKVRLPRALPDGKTAVIAADTSGSMSDASVRQVITESAAIMKACGASKLWLILHDAVPYFSGYVTDADLTKLKVSRGGTSHKGVFAILNRTHSKEEMNLPPREEVELAILFTDLGTDFPVEVPPYEVLWGVPEPSCPGMSASVPFGKKVPVMVNDEGGLA